MMVKEQLVVKRRNSKVLIILSIILFSCNSQKEYTIEQVKNLEPTHQVIDNIIVKSIDELRKNDELYSDKDDTVILYFERKDDIYNLSLTKTKFELFKKFKSDAFKNLKGYIFHNDKIVLLYGDLPDKYLERQKNKLLDVTKTTFKVDKETPPIIYEPAYIEIQLK